MSLLYSKEDFDRDSGLPGVTSDEAALGRGAFSKDYARLLHAASFRRLQGKTQLFPGGESDYFRNRLTHSLEVAQIGCGIAQSLNRGEVQKIFGGNDNKISLSLINFACIAHDLGHPPFGHNGEKALHECMRNYGGFEGNAQTLHILSSIEKKLVGDRDSYGLDLTYRSLASVIKYDRVIPVNSSGEVFLKGFYQQEAGLVERIKAAVCPGYSGGNFKTVECSIMDLADDIAYSTYDLEDALHAGFVTPLGIIERFISDSELRLQVIRKVNESLIESGYDEMKDGTEQALSVLFGTFGLHRYLGDFMAAISKIEGADSNGEDDEGSKAAGLVMFALKMMAANGELATDPVARNSFTAKRVGRLISAVEILPNPDYKKLSKVRLSRQALIDVELFKHLNFMLVINSPRLSVVEHRGKELIKDIFGAISDSKGRLLPEREFSVYKSSDEAGKMRVICDYVACMTDKAAARMHQMLFGEGASIFIPMQD